MTRVAAFSTAAFSPKGPAPAPSADADCRARHAPEERLALAEALCRQRGVQLTPLRRKVLGLLWSEGQPLGAYDLMERMRVLDQRPVAPPSVYRALDFLMAQGLVTRVASRNAFTPCVHPERPHGCVLFICSICGASAECEDPRIEALLAEDAARLNYSLRRRVIEVEGTCGTCRGTPSS